MYGVSIQRKADFDEIISRLTEALKTEGFGILTQIDVQETLKKKLNISYPRYLILGACNPQLAHRALEIDPEIGLLLPCNIVVREESKNNLVISFMDPLAVLTLVDNPKIKTLATEVRTKLENVFKQL